MFLSNKINKLTNSLKSNLCFLEMFCFFKAILIQFKNIDSTRVAEKIKCKVNELELFVDANFYASFPNGLIFPFGLNLVRFRTILKFILSIKVQNIRSFNRIQVFQIYFVHYRWEYLIVNLRRTWELTVSYQLTFI